MSAVSQAFANHRLSRAYIFFNAAQIFVSYREAIGFFVVARIVLPAFRKG